MRDGGYNQCLDLMHTLMEYRRERIYSALLKIRDKYSMLHLDVLILIYHFAKFAPVRFSRLVRLLAEQPLPRRSGFVIQVRTRLLAIESGGSVKHKRLGTRNILRDLDRNLIRERVTDLVTLIKGQSFKPETLSAVRRLLGRIKSASSFWMLTLRNVATSNAIATN